MWHHLCLYAARSCRPEQSKTATFPVFALQGLRLSHVQPSKRLNTAVDGLHTKRSGPLSHTHHLHNTAWRSAKLSFPAACMLQESGTDHVSSSQGLVRTISYLCISLPRRARQPSRGKTLQPVAPFCSMGKSVTSQEWLRHQRRLTSWQPPPRQHRGQVGLAFAPHGRGAKLAADRRTFEHRTSPTAAPE